MSWHLYKDVAATWYYVHNYSSVYNELCMLQCRINRDLVGEGGGIFHQNKRNSLWRRYPCHDESIFQAHQRSRGRLTRSPKQSTLYFPLNTPPIHFSLSIFLPLNTTSWCSPFLARTLDPPPYSIDLPPFLFQLQQLQEQQFCPNMSQQVSINITRVSHRTLHPHHAQDEGFHHTDDHLNTSGNLVLQAIPFSQRGKDFFFSVRTMRS